MDSEPQDVPGNSASVGASGSSLPSRLDSAPHTLDPPRASISSAELLELGDSLMRLGNITSHYTPFDMNSYPEALGNAFSPNDPDCLDPSTNANLLGNIMAWFHDMNPQSIALIPSATSNASPELPSSREGHEETSKSQEEEEVDLRRTEQCSPPLTKEITNMSTPQVLELECVDDQQPPPQVEPDPEDLGDSVELSSVISNPQETDISSEWEEQVHLV